MLSSCPLAAVDLSISRDGPGSVRKLNLPRSLIVRSKEVVSAGRNTLQIISAAWRGCRTGEFLTEAAQSRAAIPSDLSRFRTNFPRWEGQSVDSASNCSVFSANPLAANVQ